MQEEIGDAEASQVMKAGKLKKKLGTVMFQNFQIMYFSVYFQCD